MTFSAPNRLPLQPWILLVLLAAATQNLAADWPTHRGDSRRSGISEEALSFPLEKQWTYTARHRPSPAWPEMTAPADYYHHLPRLSPTHTYDRAFHPVITGDNLYYSSSAEDAVLCVDARSGRRRWTFFTEGPVRLAPTVAAGKVYVGSDDGHLYCLDGADGKLLWKYRARQEQDRLPGNGRMISRWPVRSGILVEKGVVYFTAGLFPSQGVDLCALDAADGKEIWKRPIGISPQGYLLASSDRLFIPTGRTSPQAFACESGKPLGDFDRGGGCFALVCDDMLVHGTSEDGQIHLNEPASREKIVSTPGLQLVAKGPMIYVLDEDSLSALDRVEYLKLSKEIRAIEVLKKPTDAQKEQLALLRKKRGACQKWTVRCKGSCELIMAGNALLAGGDGIVTAFNSADGQVIWTGETDGKVFGLAVSDGRLFASTDLGKIHCYQHGAAPLVPTAAADEPAEASDRDDQRTALYRKAAEAILQRTGIRQGYCLVLGAGTGGLAHELAVRSELQIIGREEDLAKVAAAREALSAAGLYGVRIAMHEGEAGPLPYQARSINLVVSEAALCSDKLPVAPEVARILRPCGGTVVLVQPASSCDRPALQNWAGEVIAGWQTQQVGDLVLGVATREPLGGSGEWTHAYGGPDNTICNGDALVRSPLEMQWFGRPGPRRMIDRHHRNVPPLYKDGRLFVPGDQTMYAVDAYNGTVLWQVDLPDSRRLGSYLDTSNVMVDGDVVRVAVHDECRAFDVGTGELRQTLTMPQLVADEPNAWSYLATDGKLLVGSGCKPGATYTEQSWAGELGMWHKGQKIVTSNYLFAMERGDGKIRWTYRCGPILNTTLTIGDGRLYFLETDSSQAVADRLGRMATTRFSDGGTQSLVALDLQTGKVVYKHPVDMTHLQEVVYLCHAKGILLLSGGKGVGEPLHQYLYAFAAESGKPLWDVHHNTELPADGGHGEQNLHPVVVGETVYMWPYAYMLTSGERVEGWKMDRRGHGCGGVSASAQCLFWRGDNPWMFDLGPGGGPVRLTSVTRVGCWINVIPAGGLVLMPESSSGCTCPYSIQTSMALAPRERAP